jgi:glycosyltransferase involved in cell wall biosynthesis
MALRARMKGSRPDAILAYRAYPEGYAAVLTGRKLNVPAVISVRGSDLKALPAAGAIRRKTETAMREAAAVLAVSQDLARSALALGARPERVHLVRNGVDHQVFRPEEKAAARAALSVPGDARLVLFVGNLLPVKGVPLLIDAIAALRRKGAGNLQLAIIGDGNLEPQLREQAESAGMTEAIHFLGQRRPVEVAQWMNAADLLCLPSESEGLPNVVLEAFSCGCPVVGTVVGGTPELVAPGCGLLVPPRDRAALAQAIAEALATSWDAAFIANQPIDSWEQVAARTLAICDQEVAKRRA